MNAPSTICLSSNTKELLLQHDYSVIFKLCVNLVPLKQTLDLQFTNLKHWQMNQEQHLQSTICVSSISCPAPIQHFTPSIQHFTPPIQLFTPFHTTNPALHATNPAPEKQRTRSAPSESETAPFKHHMFLQHI